MSVTETRAAKSFKWVGVVGVLGVAAALLFYFTRPAPQQGTAPTEFDGFVADANSRSLIRNASITVTLGPYSAHQQTDTFGRYSMVFASPGADTSAATVEIEAVGYQHVKNKIPLRPGSNYAEIGLNPASYASLSAGGGASGDVAAGSEPPREVFGNATVVVRNLPSDFMKANTVYVGVPPKK